MKLLKFGGSYDPEEWGLMELLDENGKRTDYIAVRRHQLVKGNYDRLRELVATKKIIGLSSYTNFPQKSICPHESYDGEVFDIIKDHVILWLHCFKDPQNYVPPNIPLLLYSETDQYHIHDCHNKSAATINKNYDFCCYLPQAHVKWNTWIRGAEVAVKWLNCMADEMGLRILVVGVDATIDGLSPKVNVVKSLPFHEWIAKLGECKYLINFARYDASPRVIMDGLLSNVPVLLNENVLGGWKYINKDTGQLFFYDADIKHTVETFMNQSYEPRKWLDKNYSVERNQALLADTVNRLASLQWEGVVDGIMFINLANRTDRLREITGELEKQGVSSSMIHRIDAVYNGICGHLGCSYSHIKALEYAKSRGWKRFIVFEDDFIFKFPRERVLHILTEFLSKYKDNWDVFMLGLYYNDVKDTDCPFVKQIIWATTTSGYMVNADYADKLHANFVEGAALCNKEVSNFFWKCPGQRKYTTDYPVDQYWFPLQKRDRWFTSDDRIGKQSDSSSSIMTK
jgi:hypothetical protein